MSAKGKICKDCLAWLVRPRGIYRKSKTHPRLLRPIYQVGTCQYELIMAEKPTVKPTNLSLLSVPAFWPMAMATAMFEEGTELYAKNLKFVDEEIKIHDELRPALATPNQVRLDLRTMVLRDYGKPSGIPTLVDAPHAGHTAMIADYHKGQSLIETLLANGIDHVALTDWKSATADMKDLEIDNYLAEIVVAIDDLGGRVNLVGLCQGGWVSAMIAARFPDKARARGRAYRYRRRQRAHQTHGAPIPRLVLSADDRTWRRSDAG
jgi:hypothetical protein